MKTLAAGQTQIPIYVLAVAMLLGVHGAAGQPLDHFKCYEAEGDEVDVTVTLEDQFGLELEVEVEEPELFCNPVEKTTVDGEVTPIGDPTAHQTGYEIDSDDEVTREVVVSNQFGEEQVLIVEEAELLLVPSEKDGVTSALNVDHFKCYEAEGDEVDVTVTLEDQFGLELEVEVEEPELFCNPVDKNGEGIIDEASHLTCYKIIAGDDDDDRDVFILNQLDGQTLEVEEPKLLCVPDIPPNKILFVTSQTFNGNLGGLAGADAKCNAAATAASLPGTYTAWLSDSSTDAKDRVTQAAIPYVRTDGITVADDFQDILNCTPSCLQAPISHDEFANFLSLQIVWTGTRVDGTKHVIHCADWTSAGGVGNDSVGVVGRNSAISAFWTNRPLIDSTCRNPKRLYCFQD